MRRLSASYLYWLATTLQVAIRRGHARRLLDIHRRSLAQAIAAAFFAHRWIELPIARRLSLRRLEGKPVLGVARWH